MEPDRDERFLSRAASRHAGRHRLAPRHYGHHGGARLRLIESNLSSVYAPDGIDVSSYLFHRWCGWRVAVPRSMPPSLVFDLKRVICETGGPSAAGYVRVGDTLVPAGLSPGHRLALADTI